MDPEAKAVTLPNGETEMRSFIKCPVCTQSFHIKAATAKNNKSGACRTHLNSEICRKACEAKGLVVPTKPKGKETGDRKKSSVHSECIERIEHLESRMKIHDSQFTEHATEIESLKQRVSIGERALSWIPVDINQLTITDAEQTTRFAIQARMGSEDALMQIKRTRDATMVVELQRQLNEKDEHIKVLQDRIRQMELGEEFTVPVEAPDAASQFRPGPVQEMGPAYEQQPSGELLCSMLRAGVSRPILQESDT